MSGLKAGDVIIVVKILSFKVHKPDITRAKWAAQCCQVGNAGLPYQRLKMIAIPVKLSFACQNLNRSLLLCFYR